MQPPRFGELGPDREPEEISEDCILLTELGEAALVDIATDAARLHMRRTVERLVKEEARMELAAE